MLTQEEVKRYAHMRRLRLTDQIWKDYLQDIVLYLLYRKMPKMVFGGGTCIWKVMKGDRFSEDIDAYVYPIPRDIGDYLKKELSLLGMSCNTLKEKRTENMVFIKIALSFPSHPREIIISIEILFSRPRKTKEMTMYSPYPDVPPVEMIVISPEEMLVNKVSAICDRNKPRDVHDLYLLLKMGINVDFEAIKNKIPRFNSKMLEKKIIEKRSEWKSLEPLVLTRLPAFKDEAEFILSYFIGIK